MIDQNMMQKIGITLFLFEDRPNPKGEDLRQARADQEHLGVRTWEIAAHHFEEGAS